MLDPDRIVELVREFIEDNDITSADAVYHIDRVLEKAPELIIALCEVVGYAEREDDDIEADDFDEDNPTDYYQDD